MVELQALHSHHRCSVKTGASLLHASGVSSSRGNPRDADDEIVGQPVEAGRDGQASGRSPASGAQPAASPASTAGESKGTNGQASLESVEDVMITPEMVEAGVERLSDLPRDEDPAWVVRWVYMAMEYERRLRR